MCFTSGCLNPPASQHAARRIVQLVSFSGDLPSSFKATPTESVRSILSSYTSGNIKPKGVIVTRRLNETVEMQVTWKPYQFKLGPEQTPLKMWQHRDEFYLAKEVPQSTSIASPALSSKSGQVALMVSGTVRNPGMVCVPPDASLASILLACGGIWDKYHEKRGFQRAEITTIIISRNLDERTTIEANLEPEQFADRKVDDFYFKLRDGDRLRLTVDR